MFPLGPVAAAVEDVQFGVGHAHEQAQADVHGDEAVVAAGVGEREGDGGVATHRVADDVHILELALQFIEQANFARNRVLVGQLLEKVRRQGYAANEGEWGQQSKIAAIAMPVRHKGQVLASINVVFLKKAMPVTEAAARYLEPLTAAVRKIESRLEERDTGKAVLPEPLPGA